MIEQFQKRLPAFEFVSMAYALVEELSDEAYHLRVDPDVKLLVEEILPLATFVKNYEAPERHVFIQFTGSVETYDAIVDIEGKRVDSGPLQPHYFVEVTSAVAPYEYLQRESLANYGSVYGGPGIRRIGKRADGSSDVESTPIARHGPDARWDAVGWIRSAIEKKSAKEYPHPCILIVRIQTDFIPSLADWDLLVRESRPVAQASKFAGTLLVNTSDSQMFDLG